MREEDNGAEFVIPHLKTSNADNNLTKINSVRYNIIFKIFLRKQIRIIAFKIRCEEYFIYVRL